MNLYELKNKALLGNIEACKAALEKGCQEIDETLIAAGLMGLHKSGEVLLACQWLVDNRAQEIDHLHDSLLGELRKNPLAFANTHDLFGRNSDWSLIPTGSYLMGETQDGKDYLVSYPQYKVEITKPFLIKKTLVTQSEWKSFIGNNPSEYQGDYFGDTSNFPVEMVSWYDTLAFCNQRSKHMRLKSCYDLSSAMGKVGEKDSSADSITKGSFKVSKTFEFDLNSEGYRLPTEKEWEYACRAGTMTDLYGELDDIAWHRGNSNYQNHPVGLKKPNVWNLYDMMGLVWEWTWDEYQKDSANVKENAPNRWGSVLKGVSWFLESKMCRVFRRREAKVDSRYPMFGFRIVRSITDGTTGVNMEHSPLIR